MSYISRAQTPAAFADRTSDLLLLAPEPQYFHARMILSAIGMNLNADSGLSLPIPGRTVESRGGSFDPLSAMQLMLSAPISAEAIRVVPDFRFGENNPPPGHVIRMNRPRFTNTTYTMTAREVPAGSIISNVPIAAGMDQVPLVVKRWVGPYDQVNSRPAPIGIERFDSNFSINSLNTYAALQLQRDFQKTINSFGVQLFDDGKSIVYPDGMLADNDAVSVGDFPMDLATVMKTQRTLDLLHVPLFSNGKRMMVLTALQVEQLMRDAEYQRLAENHRADVNPLFVPMYVGSVGNFDIFKSTTNTITNNSSSIPIQYGQAFGPQGVGVGPAQMPRVAPGVDDNFGENPMAVWIFYSAFGVLDDSFLASIRTS